MRQTNCDATDAFSSTACRRVGSMWSPCVPAIGPRATSARARIRGGSSSVRPGQRELGLALALARSATVSGRILDQFGDPMTGSVALRVAGDAVGFPRYQTPSNARGEFRILNVDDGAYVLSVEDNPFGRDLRMSVSPDQEQTVAMLPVFYPGVTEASIAASLTVSAGNDLSGLDIVVRPQPVSVIDVDVDADGRPIHTLTIERTAATRGNSRLGPGDRRMARGGGSNRRPLAPTRSSPRPSRSPPLAHRVRGARACGHRDGVSSDGLTAVSLSLVLRPGARVSGTIVHEGPVSEGPIRVGLQWPDGPRLRVAGPIHEVGPVAGGKRPFTVSSIEPGTYYVTA